MGAAQPAEIETIRPIIAAVVQWAAARGDVLAVVLVGSWARGEARPDSDVDFMLLTPHSAAYRAAEGWQHGIAWPGATIAAWEDHDYGAAWSRHIFLTDGAEVELCFSLPAWAATDPIDEGTRAVAGRGCRILYDPQGLLARLVAALAAVCHLVILSSFC
jgi:hypothetical protein